MNKYQRAKEAVYDALWELCEYDDYTYRDACSGWCQESIMEDIIKLAVKLDNLSQETRE